MSTIQQQLKEAITPRVINEATFDYMNDSDEIRDLFKGITGMSGNDDLDSEMFEILGQGHGWRLNVDDTNISAADASKFVDAVMKLGKQRGWEIEQYGDDMINIFEKGTVKPQ